MSAKTVQPRTPILLVVEDDSLVRMAIETTLRRAGYRALSVANGADAVRRLESGPIDLIVTDLYMPGMDGIELVIHLRKSVPAVPVIAISGNVAFGSEDLLQAARLLGASFTLEKPFVPEALVDAVQRLVGPPVAQGKNGG